MTEEDTGLIYKEEFDWLRERAREVSTSVWDTTVPMLNIGCWDGRGSVRAILLESRGPLVCVDPWSDPVEQLKFQGNFIKFLENTRVFGAGRVVPLRMTAHEAYASRLPKDIRFRLVFVDGDHSAETATEDMIYGWEHTVPGGITAWHDNDGAIVRGASIAAFGGAHVERFRSIGWRRKT
jgi:methyltransferase family protein